MRGGRGKRRTVCAKASVYTYTHRIKDLIYPVWTRRGDSTQAQNVCVSRQALTPTLAMQQEQRMLARIKYYNVLGWIRARPISKKENGRGAHLCTLEVLEPD